MFFQTAFCVFFKDKLVSVSQKIGIELCVATSLVNKLECFPGEFYYAFIEILTHFEKTNKLGCFLAKHDKVFEYNS